MIKIIVLDVLAYLIGSVPSGYLLVRAFRRIDVREHGSHNVGAINVVRVGGPWLGLITLIADAGKAIIIVLLAAAVTRPPWAIASAALLVMLGHSYSAWFFLRERRFSEGKSVATALGVLIALSVVGAWPWQVVAMPLGVWLVGLVGPRLLTGRWFWISPVTMAATIAVPSTVWTTRPPTAYLLLSIAMAALVLVRHKNNLRRLRAGTEPRLGERMSVTSGAGAVTAAGSGRPEGRASRDGDLWPKAWRTRPRRLDT